MSYGDIAGDHGLSLDVFPGDEAGGSFFDDLGHIPDPDDGPGGSLQREGTDIIEIPAGGALEAQDNVHPRSSLIDDTDCLSEKCGLQLSGGVGRGQSVVGEPGLVETDWDGVSQHLAIGHQVAHPGYGKHGLFDLCGDRAQFFEVVAKDLHRDGCRCA